jgi:hypothetical protein
VIATRRELSVDVFLKRFPNPVLICYYVFFPARLAPLEGCGSTTIGPRFGSFGGEWACMALLLSRANTAAPLQPQFVGLTSRNIGQIEFLDEERRVGMTITPWDLLTHVGDHPRVFVARNTHGLYETTGVKKLKPFTPTDPGTANCGTVESLDESIPSEPSEPSTTVVVTLKALSIVGLISIVLEAVNGGLGTPFGLSIEAGEQSDYPPEEGAYGVVVKPAGLTLSYAAQAQREVPWFVAPGQTETAAITPPAHSTTIGTRTYSFMVDRRETSSAKQQVWWPSDGVHVGYDGRWGPRVANDPRGRRAGMLFPNFAQIYLRALFKKLSL